jgi:hypothetical protein
MKKIFIASTVIALFAFSACQKKTTGSISSLVTASYPVITINGAQFVSMPVGGSFTDQGATAVDTILGETLQPTNVSNDIDPQTPGFYTVQYSFKNSNGYTSVGTRFVLVTDIDSALDYTGIYRRTNNNVPMNVEKVARGLYRTDNVGGVPTPSPFAITVYFGQIDDSTLVVPAQPTEAAGEMYCSNSFIRANAGVDTSISWIVRNPFFGTAVRKFVKSAN